MILITVDDWIPLYTGAQYDFVSFRHILVVSPLEENQINMDDALFGMSFGETFDRLKGGIARYCGLDTNNICLFWNNCELNDEDTPETVGMEAAVSKNEELTIHIVSQKIET